MVLNEINFNILPIDHSKITFRNETIKMISVYDLDIKNK